jgi:hypothetical protein
VHALFASFISSSGVFATKIAGNGDGLPARKLNDESIAAAWVEGCSGFPEWENAPADTQEFVISRNGGLLQF